MTEAERPGDPPSGNPTPEEISARLEALLKRTHAMRAEKAAMPASAGVTWPPSERELKHYDVVDVEDRDKAAASLAPASPPPGPQGTQAHASTTSADTAPEFGRPGWGELRLRQGYQEPAGGTRWLPVVAALLLAATIGQAAYIWYLHDSLGTSGAGHLRVNGPAGAEVRVDGSAVGNAPLDYVLTPGEYDVQVGTDAAAQRVSIERASTVVLLPAAATERASAPPTSPQPAVLSTPPVTQRPNQGVPPAPASAPAPTAAGAASTAAAGGISATRGAVVIESTPPGLPVTMEGRERGVTPITIGQLRPGRHDVLVGGLARKVDVTANQVTTLHVTSRQ